MKKIFAIIIKDTLVRFTSPVEWLFFLILPILFTVILGASTGPSSDGRVKMYVVDQANNSLSATLLDTLGQSSSVNPILKSEEEALSDFSRRKISAVLIIPENFSQDALLNQQAELELRQLPNNTDALVVQQAVQAVLPRVSGLVDIAKNSLTNAESQSGFSFSSETERQEYFDQALELAKSQLAEAPTRLNEVSGNTQNDVEYDAPSNSSAGQLITWVFIPLIALSANFAYERQKGTLRRLLTTPTSKGLYLFGTITGQVLTALVQMLLLIGFGIFVMKLNWGHAPLALAVMMITSALAAAAMGTMLGTFVKTEGQATGLSIMFGMLMALMGGCWYPLELFPQVVQQVVKILPTTWAMQGLLDIVMRGQGLSAILPNAGVLCGFALVFFFVGVLRFRFE
jgi:ABC-2 type transport system permease protein